MPNRPPAPPDPPGDGGFFLQEQFADDVADDLDPEPDPASTTSGGNRSIVVVSVVVLVLVVLGVGGFWLLGPKGISSATTGSCLAFADPANQSKGYKVVTCGAAGAAYYVTQTTSSPSACVDVPGTIQTYQQGSKVWCVGDKSVDPASTINGIQPGACVVFSGPDSDAFRAACTKGAAPVLLVLKNVSKGATDLGEKCRVGGATGTASTYSWGISRPDSPDGTGDWDRVLCLGKPTG